MNNEEKVGIVKEEFMDSACAGSQHPHGEAIISQYVHSSA
jgi:hypothetical protein